MTTDEIIFIVQLMTKVSLNAMLKARKGTALNAKYVAILIMQEEGFKPDDIADVLDMKRNSIYWSLGRIAGLILEDKEFKKMYLDCIAYIANNEDKEEEQLCA